MADQQSYKQFEHEVQHRLRDQLNHAESAPDVKNVFIHATRDLLVAIFGDGIRFYESDIELVSEQAPYYRLGAAISEAAQFKAAQANSDLHQIIGRFAEQAAHRYQQIHGNADKSLKRIYTDH